MHKAGFAVVHVGWALILLSQLAGAQEWEDDPEDPDEPPIAAAMSSGPETIYNVDWNERLAPNLGLLAHGDDLLGDRIDLHTGRLSFEHVDVSLPGNSALPVEIRRRLNPSQWGNNEFEDWQLVVPTISTKILQNEWSKGQRWGKTRCSSTLVSAIPNSLFGPDQLHYTASITYPSQYSDGVLLDVPGRVSDQVLDKTVTAAWPSEAVKVTVSGWYLTCLTNIDGNGTQGFLAIAPNGDRYRFDKIRSRNMVASTDYWHIQPPNVVYHGREHTNYDVLAATEVTDVNGNWVRYVYDTAGKLTRVHANDGRTIDIAWSSSRVTSITANPVTADSRTWTYGYDNPWVTEFTPPASANGVPSTGSKQYTTLRTVTRPDARSWTFNLAGLLVKPVPGDKYNTIPGGTLVNCQQVDQVLTVTHPDGVTGEFQLGELRRFLPDSATSQYGPPCPKASIGRGANTVADVMAVVQKKLTATGVPTATWAYDYFDAGDITPNGQNGVNRTLITRPDNKVEYHHFQPGGAHTNKVKHEVYNSWSATTPLQVVDHAYITETAAGNDFVQGNSQAATHPVREQLTTITRGSDWYKTQYSYITTRTNANYSYGFPTKVETWSSQGGGTRITDITYLKDEGDWILGLTNTVTRNGTLFDDYDYDAKGRLTVHRRFGTTIATLGYHTSGSESGRLSSYTDAMSRVTSYSSWHRGVPRTITLADSNTHTRIVDSNGWVTSATNPRGITTVWQYNAVGRLTKIDRPTPFTDTTITYTYTGGKLNQAASRGTETVTTTYDAMLRPTRVRQQATSGGGGSIYTDTTYDAMGRVIFVSMPSTSAGSSTGIQTTYDALGRVTQTAETASGGGITNFAYLAGNKKRTTDPVGKQTTETFSGYGSPEDGNVIKVERPESITVDYAYDIYGNLTTITQAKTGGATHVSSFVYDTKKRLCRRKIPETGDTLYAYNNANEMTSYAEGQATGSGCTTPPTATRISLTYDNRGRLTTTNYPGTTPDITRTYDANGNLLTINRGGANWTYTYNAVDLPLNETLVIDSRTYTTTNTWSNDERLTQRRFPSGNTYVYTNDGLGRQTSLKKGTTTYASAIAWHPNGKISSLTRGNGDVFTQNLNARQLVSFIGSDIGDDLTYTYDANGRVTNINAASNNAWDRTYTYDNAGRLKTAAGPWGSGTYGYDTLGNLTTKTLGSRTVTVEYTPTSNRVNRVKDSAVSPNWRVYSHDARGNVTGDGIHTFTYDYANQPITIAGADSGTYAYDGNLKRVKQIVGGQTIYSIYDRAGALLTRDNATTNAKTDYLAIAGQTFVRIRNNVASYPLNDHLGTPLAVAAQNGTIAASQTYNTTPFGEVWGAYSPGDANEQGYTGHIEDATGLTYMQARYYDPVMGRFLSTDPVGYLDQLNLYAYVHNDPVNMTDPSGLHGRGNNWSDQDWEQYDSAQKVAASAMTRAASKLRSAAAAMRAGMESEVPTGAEGATADEMESMATGLDSAAVALNDDGKLGYFAHQGLIKNGDPAEAVIGGKSITIDAANWNFSNQGLTAFMAGHESLHNAGFEDQDYLVGTAYRFSRNFADRRSFEKLPLDRRWKNPDHIMSIVFP